MVVVGKYRSQPELRKKPRRQFQYQARILTSEKGAAAPCAIADISDSGARLVLEQAQELPERFVLFLNASGDAHRTCRVVWREGLTIGVEFPERVA